MGEGGVRSGRRLARVAAHLPCLAVVPAAAGGYLVAGATSTGNVLVGSGLLLFGAAGALASGITTKLRGRALARLARWAEAFGEAEEAGPPAGPSSEDLRSLAESLVGLARRVREAKSRLRQSERRTRDLLETMAEGLVAVDREERITYANPNFARMLGVSPESLPGLDLSCFLDPESQTRVLAETRGRREGRSGRYELSWRRPDGTAVETIVAASPLLDARGRYRGSFGVVTDVSERRRLETQVRRTERFRALGEMAGGIAHDFNNRLTAILGNAQLLLLAPPPENQARLLRTIERAAMEGAETVRRIMDFTRSRADASREVVDMNVLVGEVVDILRYREEARAEAYRIDRDFRATRPVPGCPGELREAILGILVNAIDAMPDGGDLRVSTADSETGMVVRISDTGEGMSRETLDRAVDPFFTTRGARRTGLGLSLAWGIVRRHGGRLRLKSAVGRGTVVEIHLTAVDVRSGWEPEADGGPSSR